MKALRTRILVAAGTAVVTAAALELGARLYLGADFVPGIITDLPMSACVVPDERLGWKNRADLSALAIGPTFEHPVFRYQVRTNSHGLRDREYEYGRSPGLTRILLLGDSLAWGWGVGEGKSFADLLDRALGDDVEVINAGVPGYGTDQELLYFERAGFQYEPDVVLLCFVLNDVESNLLDFDYGLGKPRLVPRGGGAFDNTPVRNHPPAGTLGRSDSVSTWLQSNSAVVQLLRPPVVTRARDSKLEGNTLAREELEELYRDQSFDTYTSERVYELSRALTDPASPTHELLRLIKARCDRRGARFLAFSVPHRHDQFLFLPHLPLSDDARSALMNGGRFRTRLSRQLEIAGRMIGFGTHSVDHEMLAAVRGGANLNVGDGHLTELGNEIVAASLVAWLEEELERP